MTATLARLLFRYKVHQTLLERERDPVLLVCEEAHRYVPDRGEAEYAAAQGAIRRIAREGRKYGLGLMLVSQRPADLESTVIAQCGTWLVLRLTTRQHPHHRPVGSEVRHGGYPSHAKGQTEWHFAVELPGPERDHSDDRRRRH